MKTVQLALCLLILAFQPLGAQFLELKHFESLVEIEELEGEIVAGLFYFPGPPGFEALLGKTEIPLQKPSSNYNADFFRSHSQAIALKSPISQVFLEWGNDKRPQRLFLKRVPQTGDDGQLNEVYEPIGWSNKNLDFPLSAELFPEFASLDLVNFDLPEQDAYLRDNKLVAGGFVLGEYRRSKSASAEVMLNYPTSNFGKYNNLFAANLALEEPLSELVQQWILVRNPKILMFRMEPTGKYTLVGHSETPWFFQEKGDD